MHLSPFVAAISRFPVRYGPSGAAGTAIGRA